LKCYFKVNIYNVKRKKIKNFILSDIRIITMAVIGELHTIGSVKAWLSSYQKDLIYFFPYMCSRIRSNRARRHLYIG